jgi:hypothetical protein
LAEPAAQLVERDGGAGRLAVAAVRRVVAVAGGDGGVVAGGVGVVDQAAQRLGGLGRPGLVRVDLGGVVEVAQEVLVMPISA